MATVEQRLNDVEQDVSYIKEALEHLATKSDIAKLKSELMWWMFWLVIGTMVALSFVLLAVYLVTENLTASSLNDHCASRLFQRRFNQLA